MKRRAFVVGAVVLAGPSLARSDTVDDAFRDIAAARAKVQTLVAGLTQERVLSLLSTTVTSKGTLTLVRPDRLRWELEPPDAVIYWVGPEGIAYRTPQGSGKVAAGSSGPLGAVLGDLLVVLGGDLGKLRDGHDVTVDRAKDGAISLVLVPKSEKVRKLVRRLTVTLFPDRVAARKLVLEEQGDDRTTITFDAPRVNDPVDPARMRPDLALAVRLQAAGFGQRSCGNAVLPL